MEAYGNNSPTLKIILITFQIDYLPVSGRKVNLIPLTANNLPPPLTKVYSMLPAALNRSFIVYFNFFQDF